MKIPCAGVCCFVVLSFVFAGNQMISAENTLGNTPLLGPITRISPADSGETVDLVWTSADPSSAQHLIVCGYAQFPKLDAVPVGYLYSSGDGGATWHQAVLDRTTRFNSEQSCTYARDGHAYFAAGESDTSTGFPRHEWGHLVIFTSSDHGMAWRRTYTREEGWIDWTSIAAAPRTPHAPAFVAVLGNTGTDRLGHWLPSQPVAMGSRDGGATFSQLLAPIQPPGYRYIRVWASGSTMLADGTALFATSAGLLPPRADPQFFRRLQHLRVEIFEDSPVRGAVRSRAVVRSLTKTSVFEVSMAADPDRGTKRRPLYTAWFETTGSFADTGRLWLASSDDRGYHWDAHRISSQGCLGNIKIAVLPDGTLGLLWSEDKRRLLFATSHDGGRTFSRQVVVAQHTLGDLAIASAGDEEGDYTEYWSAEGVAAKAGTAAASRIPYADLEHLGMNVQMSRARGIGDYGLGGDANGVFHAVWTQAEPDGTLGLFTRTLHASPASERLAGVDGSSECNTTPGTEREPMPAAMPTLRLDGKTDVTRSFFIRIQHLRYDSGSRTLAADVSLVNKGTLPVHGPLWFVGVGVHSDYGTIVATNASGAIEGEPVWNVSRAIPANGLTPGSSSSPVPLHFQIARLHDVPDPVNGGDGVAMWVRVIHP